MYDESDPLDYENNGKNYFDARELFTSKGFYIPTLTAVPKGKEELAIENLDKIERISISHTNRKRLEPYFERLGVVIYIDIFNYYRFKYGRRVHDESLIREIGGQINVEGTVRQTIAKLRKKDPTLPTKTRYYDVRIDKNRPHEEVQDLNTLVLWCGRDEFPPRDGIITDIDEGRIHNNGRAFDIPPFQIKYSQIRRLCDISGVKITPEGIFNVLSVDRSDRCKTGRTDERVSPDDFNVLKRQQLKHLPIAPEMITWHYAELGTA